MSGMPGRSGRRPKPLADHLANGTYRRDRHGPRPANAPTFAGYLAPAPAPPPAWSWTPDAETMAALGPAGRQFLTAVLAQNDVDFLQGAILTEAARTLDDLTIWRAESATDKTAARMANTFTRTFAALIAQLRFR